MLKAQEVLHEEGEINVRLFLVVLIPSNKLPACPKYPEFVRVIFHEEKCSFYPPTRSSFKS